MQLTKVFLKSGHQKTVEVLLGEDAFSYYNVNISDWHTEAGKYEVLIGTSSQDIRLKAEINVSESSSAQVPDLKQNLSEYYRLKDEVLNISAQQFYTLYGQEPNEDLEKTKPYTINSMLSETKGTLLGNLLLSGLKKQMKSMTGEEGNKMMEEMVGSMPIRAFGMMGGGKLPKYFAEALVLLLNRKIVKGIIMLFRK